MNKLTIFESDSYGKDIQSAIRSLITGKTPITEVRKRDSRGGEVNYVNGYYMFRQASLITGFRWSSKCLREKYVPDETAPIEVGALMQVTLYDQAGNHYSHQSWGSSDVKRYKNTDKIISLFDDLKAAYTDGIKKCLSYFGIANDVYGGRELNYFDEVEGSAEISTIDSIDERTALDAYIKNKHLRYDIALNVIGVQSVSDITDYRAAYQKVKDYMEGGKKL